MSVFISSYSRILFSLLGSEMPELRKYAMQHSTTNKNDKPSSDSLLSPDQIQEAYSHPSAIIQQSLKAVATIQNALNASGTKLDTIANQQAKIEAALTKLRAMGNPAENILTELHQQLLILGESQISIKEIINKLEQERDNVDKLLLQQSQKWLQHREKFFNQLITQLEANSVALNDAEKAELRRGSATVSNVEEKLKTLEKLQIKLPAKPSDFAVIAHDAVIAYLSRTLQKVDNKTVRDIIEKLSVIDDENKASDKLKSDYASQYEQVISAVKQLEIKISKAQTLPPDQQLLLAQIGKRAKEPAPKDNTTEVTPD